MRLRFRSAGTLQAFHHCRANGAEFARLHVNLAGNALTTSNAATSALFTAYPATITDATTVGAFDWTPGATSAIATGGLNAFTGKLATAAGTAVTATAYVGAAAPGGTKWWAGWTNYAQK